MIDTHIAFATKRSLVAEELERLIIRGVLKPGERLRQTEIAERLGVSATPVREALRDLESKGLVEYVPNRGACVVEVRVEDLLENETIRAALEPLATRLGTERLTDSVLERIEEQQCRFVEAVEAGDVQAMIRANESFHMALYEAAESPQLYEIICMLWARFRWEHLALLPGRPKATVEEHEAILEALRRRDPEAAERASAEHLRRARLEFVAHLEAVGEPERDGHVAQIDKGGDDEQATT